MKWVFGIGVLFIWSSFAVPKQSVQADFMSSEENKIVKLLNEVRANPVGFEKFIIAPMLKKDLRNSYLKSLSTTLKTMTPVGKLDADKTQYVSADCHAQEIGSKGLITHERQSIKCTNVKAFKGECIAFGDKDAETVILMLLIDEGVPDLGHRKICLDGKYSQSGVSTHSHTTWRNVTVLDFGYDSD